MSGSRPTVGIRISAEGAEQVRRQLEALGPAGSKAFQTIQSASQAATPEVQKLGTTVDVVQRTFIGMGGNLGRVGSVFTGVSAAAGGMTAGFLALGAAATASAVSIAKAGDEATATMARLTSATGGLSAATAVYERLFALSQQTGIAVSESAASFGKLAVAAKEIGGTNAQVAQLVAGLQKAGIVAGASAQEIATFGQQFGQALASGVLQGDELRSMIESMPQFAQALARELGVGIGQLKQMGSEGKLLAADVFPAALRAAEKMGTEFEKMPVTMERAKGVLLAATQDFGERLDRITGLSEKFAAAMMQGASALRSMGSLVAPNEREQINTSVSQAQERLRRVQEQARADAAASAYGDTSPALRQAIEIAEQDLRDAIARQQSMLRDDRELRRAEEADAAAQRVAAARTQGERIAAEIDKGLKTEQSIREKYAKERAKIDQVQASGAWTEEQAAQRRTALAREEKEELDKIAKATDGVAAATRRVGTEAKEADAEVRAFHKQQEEAAKKAAAEAEKLAQSYVRYQERSFDELVSIGERAFDRLGDAMVNAFLSGEGAAVNFGNIARGIAASVITDFAKLAVINPILNSLFTGSGGPRPTLAAAFGTGGSGATSVGFGDMLGLGQLLGGKSIGESLGLTGSSGILSTPLWGGVDASTAALFSDATGIAATTSTGATTLGSLLGGAGAGFGAGMLLNNLLGRTGAQATNGMIGSGAGGLAGAAIGSIVPGIGTLIGGLIGGAAGGGLGGLLGPGESVKGYGYQLGASSNGMLQMGAQFYNETGRAAFEEAAAGIAQLNAFLGSRGVTVGGASIVGGNKNGPDYSNATAGTFSEGVGQLYYHANDNALDYALAQRGRQFSSASAMQEFVDGFMSVQAALEQLNTTPAQQAEKQIAAIAKQFDDLAASAREYGLSEAGIAEARSKAIEAARAQIDAEKNQIQATIYALTDTPAQKLARQLEAVGKQFDDLSAKAREYGLSEAGLAEAREKALAAVQAQENREGAAIRAYLDRLSTSDPSAAPTDRFAAAQGLFGRDLDLARSGDAEALARITSSADTLLGAGRDMFASSPEFQAIKSMVVSSLQSLPAVTGLAATQQPINMEPLVSRLSSLESQVSRLTEELRTARLQAA